MIDEGLVLHPRRGRRRNSRKPATAAAKPASVAASSAPPPPVAVEAVTVSVTEAVGETPAAFEQVSVYVNAPVVTGDTVEVPLGPRVPCQPV
jgi:hypothetical protein